ncbi:chromate transporter [Fibrobacter sp. UWH1]|uniref:chromate transporter n=1 Tax=Fibrobacter sp. UWH1 TaxID=1964354 RepID=UPI000B521DB3|nr:chromate transporter [Fibrobacter sp. UWH1]OWV09935.1 chromate transporter [Fibrobacter sp. UWH1]
MPEKVPQSKSAQHPSQDPAQASNDVAVSRNIYLDAFLTFFKIGLFTIGGGYAMIPLIEAEIIEKKKWVGKEEFLDLMAIAQSCPGVFAINIAIFIGFRLRCVKGAIVSCIGTALPSFIIILLIALFFHQFKDNEIIAAAFRGIRPAVVALIAVPTYNLAKKAKLNRYTFWVPIVSALLIWQLGVSPILIIIAAGIAGYILGRGGKK